MEKHEPPATDKSSGTDNNVISEAPESNVQKYQQKPTQTEISSRGFLRKPSMIQQRSLDSATPPFERQQEENVIHQRKMTNCSGGIRRSSTTPSNNGRKMTLAGYRYAPRPMETTPVSFPIPPVFPKTCSLYDSNFNGGAFASSYEDKKLMDALVKVRTKRHEERHISTQHFSMNEDAANLSDSGHSSITTEGASTSPQLSHFSFFSDSMNNENSCEPNDGQHSKASLSTLNDGGDNDAGKFLEVGEKCARRRSKRRSDFGLNVRKNSRIFFFRQRAKTASGKKETESAEKEGEDIPKINADNELPNQAWTIDGGKGVSWKCKLLKALSAGGIYLPSASAVSEEEKGNELLFLFENG